MIIAKYTAKDTTMYIFNSYNPLSIFGKHSILDVWQGSGYAYVTVNYSRKTFHHSNTT